MKVTDQDLKNLERMLDLVNEMTFRELKGSQFLDKFIILKNYQQTISNLKNSANVSSGKITKLKKKEGKDATKQLGQNDNK